MTDIWLERQRSVFYSVAIKRLKGLFLSYRGMDPINVICISEADIPYVRQSVRDGYHAAVTPKYSYLRCEFGRIYTRESADNSFCIVAWYKPDYQMKSNGEFNMRFKIRDSLYCLSLIFD